MDEFDFDGSDETFDFSGLEGGEDSATDLSVDLELDGSQVELFEVTAVSPDGGNVASYTGSLGEVNVYAWNDGSSVSGNIEVLIP